MIKSGLNSFPRPKFAPGGGFVPNPNSIILMHFDGANNSTTFTDVYGVVAPTATGTAVISTTRSVFGGASLHCPSGTNVISGTATSSKLNIGTGDFTIECRVYLEANAGGVQGFAAIQSTSTNGAIFLGDSAAAPPQLIAYVQAPGGSGTTYTSTGTFSINAFHALAVVRKSGTLYLFIDGALDSSRADTTNVGNLSGLTFWAGPESGGSAGSSTGMYVDELRISATGLYTSSYTPASSAFAS